MPFPYSNLLQDKRLLYFQAFFRGECTGYKKPFWNDRQSSFKAPNIQGVVGVGVAVVATVATFYAGGAGGWAGLGAMAASAAINLSDDLVFATLDVSAGLDAEQTWANFGKSALTTTAGAAIGAGFSALGSLASNVGNMGGVMLKTGIAAGEAFTRNVATNAINAISYTNGKWGYDTEGFLNNSFCSKSAWTGIASAAASTIVSAGLGELNLKDAAGTSFRSSVFNTDQIASFNSTLGNLAGMGVELAMSGNTTLNLLNVNDLIGLTGNKLTRINKDGTTSSFGGSGLLEMHVGSGGNYLQLGTGGYNFSTSNLVNSFSGLAESSLIWDLKNGGLARQNTLNAINGLAWSKNKENYILGRKLLDKEYLQALLPGKPLPVIHRIILTQQCLFTNSTGDKYWIESEDTDTKHGWRLAFTVDEIIYIKVYAAYEYQQPLKNLYLFS